MSKHPHLPRSRHALRIARPGAAGVLRLKLRGAKIGKATKLFRGWRATSKQEGERNDH